MYSSWNPLSYYYSYSSSGKQLDDDATNSTAPECLVDYVNHDWRSFLFVVHDRHGLMLLQKGSHWKLPGGPMDADDFGRAGEC